MNTKKYGRKWNKKEKKKKRNSEKEGRKGNYNLKKYSWTLTKRIGLWGQTL